MPSPIGGWSSAAVGVKLIAPGTNAASSEFGAAVSLGGDIIAVGAPGEGWHSGAGLRVRGIGSPRRADA